MKNLKRTLLCFFLILSMIVPSILLTLPVNALEDPVVTNTKSAYLYNIENKKAI